MKPLGQPERPAVLLLPVRRVMRRNFVTVPPFERLADAWQTMRVARLRHLLVEDEGALVGILSYRDLQELLLERWMEGSTPAEEEPVAVAMRSQPYTITPETRIYDAVSRLCGLRLGCLPVVERHGGRLCLVGIVTETDLLQAAYQTS
jgi:CBS-domain-containing membrane protein